MPRCKDYLHGLKDGLIHASAAQVAPPHRGLPPASPLRVGIGGSPIPFRTTKRPRCPSPQKGEGEGYLRPPTDNPPKTSHNGAPAEMLPPSSPPRRPTVPTTRSPYHEYPPSPFKRPRTSASPARVRPQHWRAEVVRRPCLGRLSLATLARTATPVAQRQVPSKYGQITLSPAQRQASTPLQGQYTPRTAFFVSFGNLGTQSPARKFEDINEKLKSPGVDSTTPERVRGPLGTLAHGRGNSYVPSADAQKLATRPLNLDTRATHSPRVFPPTPGGRGNGPAPVPPDSPLLALAHASDVKRHEDQSKQRGATERAPAHAPADATRHRMQDLLTAAAVASDIVSPALSK